MRHFGSISGMPTQGGWLLHLVGEYTTSKQGREGGSNTKLVVMEDSRGTTGVLGKIVGVPGGGPGGSLGDGGPKSRSRKALTRARTIQLSRRNGGLSRAKVTSLGHSTPSR